MLHASHTARTAREILNELKWGERGDWTRVTLWIADRTSPEGARILSGSEIVDVGRRYFRTEGATIPLYKILRIEFEGRIRFERREVPKH